MVQSIRRVGKQFRPHRQEDAHEYLRQLLDCMHEEILKANNVKTSDGKVAETTLISRVFGGSLRNELKCLSCRFSSKTYNHFQDLSLEISGGISSGDFIQLIFVTMCNRSSLYRIVCLQKWRIKSSCHVAVSGALKAFMRSEKLSSGNEWRCDGCKKKVQVLIAL